MYRDRGGGSSKSEIVGGTFDRKRINDALDKHLEKSNSRVLNISKERSRLAMPSSSTAGIGKLQQLQKQKQVDYRDNRSSSTFTTKNKCSDGWFFRFLLLMSEYVFLIFFFFDVNVFCSFISFGSAAICYIYVCVCMCIQMCIMACI